MNDSDRLRIHELYGRYAYAFDSNHPDQWAATFTEDGIFHLADRDLVGREAIARHARERNEVSLGVSHHVTNIVLDDGGGTVRGKAYLLALRIHGGDVRLATPGSTRTS